MATIRRRPDRGDRWEVRYRDPGNRQRANLFARKVDAERFAATTGADIVRGSYVDPALGRLTFARFVDEHYRPTMVNLEATTRARATSRTCGRTSSPCSGLAPSPPSSTQPARRG